MKTLLSKIKDWFTNPTQLYLVKIVKLANGQEKEVHVLVPNLTRTPLFRIGMTVFILLSLLASYRLEYLSGVNLQ